MRHQQEHISVNTYQHLIGQSFTRNGTRLTVVKCEGATVIAAFLQNRRVQRMLVPLDTVLASLEVAEPELTKQPLLEIEVKI